MSSALRMLALFGLFAFLTPSARAEDQSPVPKADAPGAAQPEAPAATDEKTAAPAASEADISQWIIDLDANKFSQRQVASDKLFAAGKAAVKALGKAAESSSREVQTRAIELLKRHLEGADAEAKTAAKAELERLAASDNESAKGRAQAALKPKEDETATPRRPFAPGGIQIGGGQIQIQVQAVAGPGGINGRRVTVKNVNGVKEIEAVEGDRKVKINEDPNGIKIEVTTKKDGKEATEKFEAKNLDELRKNHPQGAKVYDEFNNGAGGIQIQAIQVGPGGGIAIPQVPGGPFLPPNLQPAPPRGGQQDAEAARSKARESVKEAQKRLAEARDRLKKELGEKADVQDIEQAIADLEKTLQELGGNK